MGIGKAEQEAETSRILPTVAMELLMQLVPKIDSDSEETQSNLHLLQKPRTENLEALESCQNLDLIKNLGNWYDSFSMEQQSEILDRFYSRQKT